MSASSVEKVTITVTKNGKHLKVRIPRGEVVDIFVVSCSKKVRCESNSYVAGDFEVTYQYKIARVWVWKHQPRSEMSVHYEVEGVLLARWKMPKKKKKK